jgi:2-keto-4-pentenoate hydratase/2-oxohepta-3-ene-1,7-dioic acid hydratase in catechol pathway
MKLATFEHHSQTTWGFRRETGWVDLPSVWPDGPGSVLELLQLGSEAIEHVRRQADSAEPIVDEDVRLLAPLPRPPKVLALAGNYAEHVRECAVGGGSLPENPRDTTTPRAFLMPATAVVGPDETIPWCVYSEQLDHEVELAVILGSPARRVSPDQARDCIAGYTIANDISARSVTFTEGRTPREPKDGFFDWLHGKWADGFCPMGPVLVTADELADPDDLALSLTVNGQIRQDSSTACMIFNSAELVSFCSHLMTLEAGDVILTGTPHGVGVAKNRFLQPGDVMTCRIEGIGTLSNTLGQRPEQFYAPCRD